MQGLLVAGAAFAFQMAPVMHHAPVARRAADAVLVAGLDTVDGNIPTTIGEAKDNFFAAYKRPVNAMQQQFVNEMLTSCSLAFANSAYKPSRVFYVGFMLLTDTFLEGVQVQEEREKIFSSICAGLALDPVALKKEADQLKAFAEGKTIRELVREKGLLEEKDLNRLLNPDRMTRPRKD